MTEQELRFEILDKVKNYYKFTSGKKDEFVAGNTKVNYAGICFDENELINLIDSSLDFWLTYSKYSRLFEEGLANYLNIKHCLFVNSGSSANLLAFMALTSPLLGERRIHRGDEVITIASCFPTTIAPIVQFGAVPVFADIDLKTCNIDTAKLDQAISRKTKAIMLAHTLGNPFDLNCIKEFCSKNKIWLIEDNCDSLGSKYDDRFTGTFGDIGTSSFYPAHHITTGEGGAVYTNNQLLYKILRSLRDWGRDCWCESGNDNSCGNRFEGKYGNLPFGYDHKYVFSHFGYNFKATDLQASIGLAQLEKLENFTQKRIKNFDYLFQGLKDLENFFILPTSTKNSKPSWFGFLLIIRDDNKFKRNDIVKFLEKNNIQTRFLFGGNIIKQPCFQNLEENRDYRIIGQLNNTDKIMNDGFWIGLYPGMTFKMLDYMIEKIHEFIFMDNN